MLIKEGYINVLGISTDPEKMKYGTNVNMVLCLNLWVRIREKLIYLNEGPPRGI